MSEYNDDRLTRYRYVVGIDPSRHTTRFLDLDRIQQEIIDWQVKNFGHVRYTQPLMGMMEELGELSHAFLKQEQGIRGSEAEHQANAKDAVGDLMIYTMALCQLRGWRLSDIIEETWLHVRQRDWTRNKTDGSADVQRILAEDR